MLKLKLIRKIFTTNSTIGELYVDGVFQCYTLEDVARVVGVKIKSETCIPAGNYTVKITHSNRYNKLMPLVYDNPKLTVEEAGTTWSGIRIHPGNTDADTAGCILPGKSKAVDMVTESKSAFEAFYNYLFTQIGTTKTAELEIINQQEG